MTDTPSIRDTSNAALAARYDEIPYAALPHPTTHPDRLATVATFLGRTPPDLATCSVLEVGCNDGANLIPMALSLPGARFIGCDLSLRAIEAGRRTIAALGLSNVALVEEDLATLSPAHGAFDYIVAHGVYSWVPPTVRDGLFGLARERLSPNGIMFVSFNVLPGCRVRQAAWDVLHRHVDRLDDPRARLDAARQVARLIADGSRSLHDGDDALRAEFRAIAGRADSALAHDDLAVPNEPVYFSAFAEHASRYGLRYLAEAELHTMSAAGVSADARSYLTTLGPLEREQSLDFIRLRRFRQSLLCRSDAASTPTMHPQRLAPMHVAANASLLRAAEANRVGELAQGLDPSGGEAGPVRALLDALVARQPSTIAVAAIGALIDRGAWSKPIEALLADAYVSGIVDLYLHPPRIALAPGERPLASPLARLQARSRDELTNLLHSRVRIADRPGLELLTLLDGSRDRAQLAAAVRRFAPAIDPGRAPAYVDYALAQFGRLGLMMA